MKHPFRSLSLILLTLLLTAACAIPSEEHAINTSEPRVFSDAALFLNIRVKDKRIFCIEEPGYVQTCVEVGTLRRLVREAVGK